MNTYIALYLFVKLDDIRVYLSNDYGLTLLFIVLSLLIVLGYLAAIDASNEEVLEFTGKHIKKFIVGFLLVFSTQFTFNVIATVLPSTGQMAAIYLGGRTVESNTASILAELPEKYATLLSNKADEWVASQLPEVEAEKK
jgi:hypothetical protein